MTIFTINKPSESESINLTASILDLREGPHTFPFNPAKQSLTIENNEAVSITVTLTGENVTTVEFIGYGDVDVSAGKAFTVTAGQTVIVNTAKISKYLGAKNNVVTATITGTTGTNLAFGWVSEW